MRKKTKNNNHRQNVTIRPSLRWLPEILVSECIEANPDDVEWIEVDGVLVKSHPAKVERALELLISKMKRGEFVVV
jgi:hypothetical protein